MKLWMAQYNYRGPGRFDVTFKTDDKVVRLTDGITLLEGQWFAPTEEMVRGYKYGKYDWQVLTDAERQDKYIGMYYEIISKVWTTHGQAWDIAIRDVESLTLVCYCRPGAFCHRRLLANYFQQRGARYMGERR